MKTLIIILSVSCLFINGCAIIHQIEADENLKNITQLEVGMTKDEVIFIMNTPQKIEAYGNTELLIYRTIPLLEFGTATDEYTSLCIKDSILTGWSRKYYQSETKGNDIDIIITQTN